MQVTTETITPRVARAMLEANTNNRHISRDKVAEYANEIRAGRWQLNGSTIVMNGSRLLDGQHRLLAVIEADQPIKTLVVKGVDDSVFATIDTGKMRTKSDVLSISGEKNCSALASSLAIVERYYAGRLNGERLIRFTNAEILILLEKYPDMREFIDSSWKKKKAMLLTQSSKCAMHYLFSKVHKTEADRFFVDLSKGQNLQEGDPVLALRHRLILNSVGRAKLPAHIIIALVIKAFNARLQNKSVSSIGYYSKEKFPKIGA
jgi:hypothetical protein